MRLYWVWVTKRMPGFDAGPLLKKEKTCGARRAHRRCGAGGRIRTPDLLITNQLLYQLSYTSILTGITIPSACQKVKVLISAD